MLFNESKVAGRFASDPEMRHTGDGTPVCTFSLAVPLPGKKDEVVFLRLVAWRANAENIVKFFSKGDGIFVEGYNQIREYVKSDQQKAYTHEIVVERWAFPPFTKKSDSTAQPEASSRREASPPPAEEDDSDLPF